MAKQEAYDKHCKEAIFIRDGIVTEGSSTNLFMVKDGMLLTHPADHFILHGITRKITLQLADQLQIPVSEKKFGKESLLMPMKSLSPVPPWKSARWWKWTEKPSATGAPVRLPDNCKKLLSG